MELLKSIEAPGLKDGIPEFRPGDKVRVHVKVREGEKERIQVFEGDVIARRMGGARSTFTVRSLSNSANISLIAATVTSVRDSAAPTKVPACFNASIECWEMLHGKWPLVKARCKGRRRDFQ